MADPTDTPKIPEMVERAARRLFVHGAGLFLLDTPTEPKWEDASPIRQMFFCAAAADIIAALREPTEAMVKACFDGWRAEPEPTAQQLWHVMIDAALGE
jgi:hypothetical protein